MKEKYENIAPKLKYLKDEVILAQSWKKSHTYIRMYNWYADLLELDCSIVDLGNKLKVLSNILENQPYTPKPLRVVLAPKNQTWHFPKEQSKSWSPMGEKDDEKGEQDLRPLAHISIRDQTAATAVMLCLANAIESAQGPTEETDFIKAQKEEIYSYGNRLHCDWSPQLNKKRKAKFNWGSSKCYRQYFDDYKIFLKRPKNICNHYASILDPENELYVITLDLSKFYNQIDIDLLINELKELYREYFNEYNLSEEFKDDQLFWKKVKEIFNWEWFEKDYKENDRIIESKNSALGLPQGLVASGFFSNAYLIRFDRLVGKYLNTKIKQHEIRILDYCRYVDDIRLVVEASKEINLEELEHKIYDLMEDLFAQHLKSSSKKVDINKKKTRIITYRQISVESNISAVMNTVQHRISGTPDTDSLHQIVGELVGFLRMSDNIEKKGTKKVNALKLSRIYLPDMDIRDDTLKRFSASRLVKTLRMKKSMTVQSEKVAVNEMEMKPVTAGELLDHEFETVARNLISSWAENPSLSLLLKCGFELYPDVKLLLPVLEALELKLFDKSIGGFNERKTAEYVISDLLRAASISIGYKEENVYPEYINIVIFREELAAFARRLLEIDNQFPWYVKQQAILFLFTNGDYGFTIDEDEEELKQYCLLHDSLLYRTNNNSEIMNKLATSFVAQQLNPNKQKYASWFIYWMNDLNEEEIKKQVIKTLLMNRPDLLEEVLQSNRIKVSTWKHLIPSYINACVSINKNLELDVNIKESIPLLRIVRSKNNPFKQENALLLLAKALLKEPKTIENLNKGTGIANIKVQCKDWKEVQNPSSSDLSIEWLNQKEENAFNLFEIPSWVEEDYKGIYTLGAILRACLTGNYDFTAHTFLQKEDIGIYRGIKSTSFTRRYSLINQGKGLVEEPVPITPWLSELLYKLLQWPGINQWEGTISNWEQVINISDLQSIIEKRLNHQRKIYGKLSQTPMYTLPIPRRSKEQNSKLRFAVVQPLLPQLDDFNEKDPTNWNTLYRKRHRDHLASISQLVNKQIKSTIDARRSFDENSNADTFEGVDVIIFPELSVHPDDIQILRSLSDATKAHIFAGLTFLQPAFSSRPINQALWLLRSERVSGREFIEVYQGKQHMTNPENKMGIQSHRPYQVLIELEGTGEKPVRLAGAICYDATDLAIAADLRDVSDVFIISAMNKDIQTFDNMVSYLHYHMYQPVILANTGEFGGSTVQAPFSKNQRTIAHVHGNQQIAISIFEIDPTVFKKNSKPKPFPDIKTPPAGYERK